MKKKMIVVAVLMLCLMAGNVFATGPVSAALVGTGVGLIGLGTYGFIEDWSALGWSCVSLGGIALVASFIGFCTDDFGIAQAFESDPVLKHVKLEESEKGMSFGLKFDF